MNKKINIIVTLLLFSCPSLFGRWYSAKKQGLFESEMKVMEMGDASVFRNKVLAGLANEKSESELSKDYFLIGMSYFYEGEYSKAWENVLNSQKLFMLEEEKYFNQIVPYQYSISKDFKEFANDRCVVRLKGKTHIMKDDVFELMEKALNMVSEVFDYVPEDKILIEIYDSKEEFAYASTLGQSVLENSGAVGICKFNKLMILSPQQLLLGFRWKDTIAHELNHLIINRISKVNCPLWLHEGIARYYDTRWRSKKDGIYYLTFSQKAKLVEAVKEDKLVAFERMHPSLVYLDTQEEMNIAFAQVASVVDYLVRTYGDEIIQKLLASLENYELNDAFKQLIKMDFSQLEKTWLNYVKGWPDEEDQGALLDSNIFDKELDEIKKFVGADLQGNIRLGDKFFKNNNYLLAQKQYEKALSKESNNPVILNKLSKAYLMQNEYKEAEKQLLKSMEKNPNYVTSYTLLGDLYFELGRSDDAKAAFEESAAINPFNPHVRKRLALLYIESGNLPDARRELEICNVLSPGDSEVNEGLRIIEDK
ncbi:MAG: tetratricopeptide repeat protein [bacterium]